MTHCWLVTMLQICASCREARCTSWQHWDHPVSCSIGPSKPPSSDLETAFMLGRYFGVQYLIQWTHRWEQPARRKGLGWWYIKCSCFCSTSLLFTGGIDFCLSMFQEAFSSSLWRLTELQSSRKKYCQSLRRGFQIFPHGKKLSLFSRRLSLIHKVVQLAFFFQTFYEFSDVTISGYCVWWK